MNLNITADDLFVINFNFFFNCSCLKRLYSQTFSRVWTCTDDPLTYIIGCYFNNLVQYFTINLQILRKIVKEIIFKTGNNKTIK